MVTLKKRMAALVILLCLGMQAVTGNINLVSAVEKEAYPYLIKINRTTNVVTIYEKDASGKYTKPYKAFVCSTGKATPVGTFYTPNRFRWQPLMHNVWGQYCTQITGNILFHSVYYDTKNPADVNISAYNKLGTTASAGCVRLKCGDAKWIYDHCPLGTTVKIYNGTSKDDVLGKPKSIKISTGWDPTDPNKNNPWHNRLISIQFSGNKKIACGSPKLDLQKYVTLTDICGTKVNKNQYLKISGKVNTNKPGKYKVTYSATDKAGSVSSKTVAFKVVDNKKPVITGIDPVTLERNASFDVLKGVKAQMASGKNITKKIKVTTTLNTKLTGTYVVQYQVKGTNGKIKKASRTIKVIDTKAPVVKGMKNKKITISDKIQTEQDKVNAIKQDAQSKLQITDNGEKISNPMSMATINVVKISENQYDLICTVIDKSGNKTEVKVQYTISTAMEQTTTQAASVSTIQNTSSSTTQAVNSETSQY